MTQKWVKNDPKMDPFLDPLFWGICQIGRDLRGEMAIGGQKGGPKKGSKMGPKWAHFDPYFTPKITPLGVDPKIGGL